MKFIRAFVKLLKGVKQPEETVAVNMAVRDCGRNFSNLRDAHVRQLLLFELKNNSRNAPFQFIIEQLEIQNRSVINTTEHFMFVEQNEFAALKESWSKNDMIDLYFNLKNPDPQKIVDTFALSYLRSYHAFSISIENFDPNLLHEWRKRLKDVQYQFELLYKTLNSEIQNHYQKIQSLCNILGELNDWDMMYQWISNNRGKLTGEDRHYLLLSEDILKQRDALLRTARANGTELYTYSPDRFKDQLF